MEEIVVRADGRRELLMTDGDTLSGYPLPVVPSDTATPEGKPRAPIESILAEVLQPVLFRKWLERQHPDAPCTQWLGAYLAAHLAPHLGYFAWYRPVHHQRTRFCLVIVRAGGDRMLDVPDWVDGYLSKESCLCRAPVALLVLDTVLSSLQEGHDGNTDGTQVPGVHQQRTTEDGSAGSTRQSASG